MESTRLNLVPMRPVDLDSKDIIMKPTKYHLLKLGMKIQARHSDGVTVEGVVTFFDATGEIRLGTSQHTRLEVGGWALFEVIEPS